VNPSSMATLPPLLFAPLLSMAVAQIIKPFLAVLLGHRWRWSRMFDTGGMPSSHTSLVTTLTIAVGAVEGISSTMFSIVLVFSGYFVFEATGLRQEVGHQARVLNEMLDDVYKTHHLDAARLRELVGHTWKEVFGGVLVGILVFLVCRSWILAG
jgi:uncharacterized protein